MELPFNVTVQPAHLFAQGAVTLLHQLGVQKLVFGAEHPEMDFARLVQNRPIEVEQFKRFDQTYATAYQQHLTQKTGIELRGSNDILGFTYALANDRLGQPLEMVPLKREGAQHGDSSIRSGATIASASSIRAAALAGNFELVKPTVPESSYSFLEANSLVNWQSFWPLLRYRILTETPDTLRQFYQMTEGIEYRLLDAAQRAITIDEFLALVKTKRYTYTRIQRLISYVLLNASTELMMTRLKSARVLAFNNRGRSQLNRLKSSQSLQLITKLTDDWQQGPYFLDNRVDELRRLLVRDESTSQIKRPFYLK
nr:nucleotidyltransferase family protein [Secundilactobacillus oryzae]